jgi:hypothetical protein
MKILSPIGCRGAQECGNFESFRSGPPIFRVNFEGLSRREEPG